MSGDAQTGDIGSKRERLSEDTRPKDGQTADDRSVQLSGPLAGQVVLRLLSWLRRHWLLTGTMIFVTIVMTFVVWPRPTAFVVEANTEIIILDDIDRDRTSVPLTNAVLCFPPEAFPVWAGKVDFAEGDRCGRDLQPGKAPRSANALEPEHGSRARISRRGDGLLRFNLSSPDARWDGTGPPAGYLVGDGVIWDLPSFVFVVFDTEDPASGRVISFRAAAEIGDQPGSQRLLFDGTVEIQRRGITGYRFTARSERLRTGDSLHFVDQTGARAKVKGVAAAAPASEGALRVTIQASGTSSPVVQYVRKHFGKQDESNGNVEVDAAEISRIGTDPYQLAVSDLDNLLADPLFLHLSGILGLIAVIGSVFAIAGARSGVTKDETAEILMGETGSTLKDTQDKEKKRGASKGVASLAMGLLFSAAALAQASDAKAEYRQVYVGGSPNIGQGFLVASKGLCYAIMPKHLLLRPDGLIAGRATLAPEGGRGAKIGARLHAEMPFDAVILETEGTPPGGCGPSIHTWQPGARETSSGTEATSLRFIAPDGGIRTISLEIRTTTPTDVRIAPLDRGFIQQTMSGSLVIVFNEPIAMLLTSEGDDTGWAMRIGQILASAREILGGPARKSQEVAAVPVEGPSLSLATAGASLLLSSAAPVEPSSGAAVLLAPLEDDGHFRAVAPDGARLEFDLAGENARAIGCIRLEFAGVPAEERPRSVSFDLSAVDTGPYLAVGTRAISSINDATDRPFGLPHRARRIGIDLQPSRHPDGILSVRRLIVLEAEGSSGRCP